ncbi:MAG: diacylglycerol/lipid kinase family protein, partial [Gemmatimonadota bacterium]
AVDAGREVIVAVGGDGTVHEIAQGLLGPVQEGRPPDERSDAVPSLAVVPIGTGNDFFRMVGASRDPDEALNVALRGTRSRFDVGVARWDGGHRYFVNLLGLGVDVEVLRRRRAFGRLPGLAQYLAALLTAVLRFEPFSVRIRLDGRGKGEGPEGEAEDREELVRAMHLAAVTVGPSAGGGFLLNPGATPDDGLLDLCLVEALTYPQIARYIPRVIRGTHADLHVVELRRFRRGRIERSTGQPFWFQLDGELMAEPVPSIEIEVMPGALPVLVPPDSSRQRHRGRDEAREGTS